MPVNVRPQRPLGVVGVNHAHIVESQQAIGFGQHIPQPGLIGDIETACE